MPKLPHISGAQAIKALERLGFVVTRQSGTHHLANRLKRLCCAQPQGIKSWNTGGILRQAGVSTDEFLRVL